MTEYALTTYTGTKIIDKISFWWSQVADPGAMLVGQNYTTMRRDLPLSAQEIEEMQATFPWDETTKAASLAIWDEENKQYIALWSIRNPDVPEGTTFYTINAERLA